MLKDLLKTLKRKAENGKDEPDAKKIKKEIKEVPVPGTLPYNTIFIIRVERKLEPVALKFVLLFIFQTILYLPPLNIII